MEYYSALNRFELFSHEEIWRKLKCMLLTEKSQFEKAIYCVILTIRTSGKDKKKVKEIVKTKSVVAVGRRDELVEHRGVLAQ